MKSSIKLGIADGQADLSHLLQNRPFYLFSHQTPKLHVMQSGSKVIKPFFVLNTIEYVINPAH